MDTHEGTSQRELERRHIGQEVWQPVSGSVQLGLAACIQGTADSCASEPPVRNTSAGMRQ